MKRQTRDLLLFAAGVPGAATPFLPFATGWWIGGVTPFSLVTESSLTDSSDWFFLGLAVPLFLPIIATLWQMLRLRRGVPSFWQRGSVVLLASLALAVAAAADGLFFVGAILESEAEGFVGLAALLSLVVANVLVLTANRKGRSPPDDTAECFLLGCYLCHAVILLLTFMPDLDVGGMLVAWTCIAYTATIVVRVLSRRVLAPE